MTSPPSGGSGARWLIAGIVAGASATLGVTFGIAAWFGDDTPARANPAPEFIEETSTSGVEHVYDGEFHFFVGGGVAVFDCDQDMFPDLFFAGGTNPSSLYRNVSEVGGALRFSKVADDDAVSIDETTGAYPIDVDSDGVTDLAVLRLGENHLLRGLGDCRFERADQVWGVDPGDEWTVAFSAKWEAGAHLPTMAFGNYVALTEDREQAGGCSDSYLFRPDGATYGKAIPLSPGWCTLSILFDDWDRSGRRDLRMTNDRHYYLDGEDQLWRVAPGEPPRLYTEDEGWQSIKIWGMGIASADLTGDGMPEVFLTSQSDNKLQTLAGGSTEPRYEDVAFVRGATAHRPFIGDIDLPSTAWHPEFQDVNNDTLIDLYISKGNVEAQPEFAMQDPNNLLIGQPDGGFVEGAAEAGIVNMSRTRGAALVDLNLDGTLDLVEVNRREPVKVWRNTGWAGMESTGHWIGLRLHQEAPNVDAIGAWIELEVGNRTLRREINIGGGHAGGQLGWAHFGLGAETSAEIRVQWPDGEWGPWMNVRANRFVVIERGVGEISNFSPEKG